MDNIFLTQDLLFFLEEGVAVPKLVTKETTQPFPHTEESTEWVLQLYLPHLHRHHRPPVAAAAPRPEVGGENTCWRQTTSTWRRFNSAVQAAGKWTLCVCVCVSGERVCPLLELCFGWLIAKAIEVFNFSVFFFLICWSLVLFFMSDSSVDRHMVSDWNRAGTRLRCRLALKSMSKIRYLKKGVDLVWKLCS